MTRFSGVYTAIITPFKEGGIDSEGLKENIRDQIVGGVDGIVVLGTTGEAPTLTKEEKRAILKIAKEETEGKTQLIVGTGNYGTEETKSFSKEAEELGADALLVVTPYYNKPTQEGIYRHFVEVAESVKIPIMIYDIPGRTGTGICCQTMIRLAQIENICGVKSSTSVEEMGRMIEETRGLDFAVLSGDDAAILPLMALGGQGVVSVMANLIPERIKGFVEVCRNGDFDLARDIHYDLIPLIRVMFIETNPIPIKVAMQMIGKPSGGYRLPLCGPTPEHYEQIKEALHHYDSTQSKLKESQDGLPVS